MDDANEMVEHSDKQDNLKHECEGEYQYEQSNEVIDL